MNKEEIKEIIDNLIRFRNEDNKFQPEDILTIEDVWLLLDYITNLQEEIERLNNKLNIQDKKFKKWNKLLNDENHKLNNIINELENILKGDKD